MQKYTFYGITKHFGENKYRVAGSFVRPFQLHLRAFSLSSRVKENKMFHFEKYSKEIANLCSKFNVRTLFAFGSATTAEFNADSDVDLLVDFKKENIADYFDNFFEFKYSLQDLFGREVDLVEDSAVSNKFFRKSIDAGKVLIYG